MADEVHTTEAEGWRPEAGDVLVGVIEDIDIGWSDAGTLPGSLTIVADHGTKSANIREGGAVTVHCFHDVLFSRVMTLRPAPGETVGIQFHGKMPHKSKSNQTVSRYTFKVQGRAADAGGLYDRLETARRPERSRVTPVTPVTPQATKTADFTPATLPNQDDPDDIPF